MTSHLKAHKLGKKAQRMVSCTNITNTGDEMIIIMHQQTFDIS